MTKQEIRKLIKEKRKNLTREFIFDASRNISASVLSLECIIAAKSLMIFMSAFNEPRTEDIITAQTVAGKKIIVPVSNIETHTIKPVYLNAKNFDELTDGAYGIKEPKNIITANIADIDAAIIPGLAFSESGDRIGFGMGYYDRFLQEYSGIKIGICYDFQIFDSLPAEKQDIKMDIIITEKRIYNDI